jgi:serine/threonine protein kinase/tetratricopeptide (TPR) repeat protein
MTGNTVLHYKIGDRLGAGGMGEVYRAEDVRLGRSVAIKFLPSSFQYDPGRRERFMREARAASALRSPHVAAIFDIGEADEGVFIVMELVEGELLSERIERGPLPPLAAVDIASQIADALDEAGAQGIVHRDIKSSNVAVTPRGLVKVLDFGLAKMVGTGGDAPEMPPTVVLPVLETIPGTILGTVAYMSPEQALGKSVDPRSDIFSAGVVLYEMVTGRLPFEGRSATEVIDNVLHAEPLALQIFNRDVPVELELVVRKALAKEVAARYQNARQFYVDLHELRRILGDPDHTETIILRPARLHATGPRDTRPVSSGSFEPLVNPVAVMTFSNITKEPADAWIGAGIAETVTADLKKVSGISVIGRERVFEALKDIAASGGADSDERYAIEVGQRVGAAWIVGGGYQRIGEQIRITARFIDVATGTLIKSVKIDGQISEIFDLQDKIVYELTQNLNLELGPSEILEIERHETRSVEAYECYSRAMMNLRSASRESLDRAIFLLGKATEYDPEYAPAWAALGAAYDLKASFLSLPELAERAVECELRAIALSPRLARAHEWLGGAYVTLGRYDDAIAAIGRALEIDRTSASARQTLARAYWIGKGMIDEAIAELERVAHDDSQLGYAFLQLGFLYNLRREFAKAETVLRKAIELQERHISGKVGLLIVGARTRLGYVYYLQGRYEDALREYELEMDYLETTDHALKERHLVELHQKIGAACLRVGRREQAEEWFAEALELFERRVEAGSDDPHTTYYIACLHALRGESDRALRMLAESSAKLGALNRVRAPLDPDLESVHGDARFREALGASEATA